jgi:16S rRNA (guanine(966)-N(2))-methyltransferase RsmD
VGPRAGRHGLGAGAAGGAGRVIAGSARGIGLAAVGEGTRPLGDRVKEALFAILEPELRTGRFLDLFAGSGAGGIEALSRGVEAAVFVERDAGALRTIDRNLVATHLAGPPATVVRGDALRWLERGARSAGPFSAILVDPPYDAPDALDAALERIARPGPGVILAEDGVVVAKHFSKTALPARIGLLRSARERRFGETTLTFYRWPDEEGEADA